MTVKQTKWITVLVIILVSLLGCIRDVDLNIKNKNQEYVLNCILNTSQDTITARLTQTRNIISEETFEAVKDTEITLLENDKNVGQFTSSDSSAYFLVYKPKPGAKYRMEAKIGNDNIWGETTVPKEVEASIEKLASSMEGYQLTFKDNRNDDNFYWISATGYERLRDTNRKDTIAFYMQKNIAPLIMSNFEYADDFNRYTSENTIYNFEYDYYIRFSDNQLPDDTVKVKFRPMVGSSPELFFLSTDYNLDKYMKSSLLMERMDLYAEDMPVIYSPQPVYSNIHGGTGIFGSYVCVSKKF